MTRSITITSVQFHFHSDAEPTVWKGSIVCDAGGQFVHSIGGTGSKLSDLCSDLIRKLEEKEW